MRKRLIDWIGDSSLPFAVALSVLLHACAFLVSDLLFPETPERREFKVRLARAPRAETKRFMGKRVKIPRLAPTPYIGPEGPKGAPEPTGLAEVAPMEPGVIFLPAPEGEALPERERISRVEPEGEPAVLPGDALDFYKEVPTLEQEGVRIQDLEVGGHKSAILIDPEDKRNVSGFFYVPVNETRIEVKTNPTTIVGTPYGIGYPKEVRYLVDYISDKTLVRAKVEPYSWDHVLEFEELQRYPLLLNPGVWKDEIGTFPRFYDWIKVRSVEDLGEYLRKGGFAMMRGGWMFAQVERYLRGLLGEDAVSTFDINDEEPLFESFLDFPDMERPHIAGRGIKIRNRIAVLSGDLKFEITRTGVSVGGTAGYRVSNIAKRRTFFMFNAVLYALTQPGSIGRQYVMR